MYPLLLNTSGRLAVVVGGSDVGLRKARGLFEAGARVRIVSSDRSPSDGLNGRLEWITAPYSESHLDGASLVIAAATPEVNRTVAADARARGIWVNVAADPQLCDFVLPATIRRGDFLLAIGTGGSAPNLAQRVREQLELAFDNAFGDWVDLLAELRPVVRKKIHDLQKRAAVYHALSDWGWLDQIRTIGVDQVRMEMLAAVDRWAIEFNGTE